MSNVAFTTTILSAKDWLIVHLPESASHELPSRGLVMTAGSLNGYKFRAALEPDGMGSHWFRLNDSLISRAALQVGASADIVIEAIKDWDEPDIPADIQSGIVDNPTVAELWRSITPMARWDWIRWIRATNNPETRSKHIEVAVSKLSKGTRRPCCFNRNVCTEMYIARSGRLAVEPANQPV